ncbi:Venom dipeptidyl peptidase 4 [Halotydeus destructor]|nr:Venom dipeptidyl peptidase 4 [Halotydeus destructor]
MFANEFDAKKGATVKAYFLVYDIANRNVTYLTPPEAEETVKLQYANFGSTGSQLIFVHDYNVYYQPAGGAAAVRILQSPPGHLFYRLVPDDWVTADDSESPSFAFTEDGQRLAIVSYDNTDVTEACYGFYGDYEDTTNQNAEIVSVKFPKPGTTIPKTSVAIIDLTDGNYTVDHLPSSDRFGHVDNYLSFSDWMTNDTFLIGWQNRIWNESNAEICSKDGAQWTCKEIFYYQTHGFGWIEMVAEISYQNGFLMRYPVKGPNGHVFEHVVRVSDKGVLDILSSGDYQVTSLLGYDEDNEIVYFLGTEPGKPRHRQLYKIDIAKGKPEVVCVTCSSKCCSNNDIKFSEDMKYYVSTCSGPSPPKVVIKKTADHSEVVTLEDNYNLTSRLSEKKLPKIKTYRVYLSGPYYANVRLYLPPDMPLDGSKKVPMVVYVYGGPSEQFVTDNYEVGFSSYMSASRGYVYAKMDVRGGGFEGLNKTFQMHNQLGNLEIHDFIRVTKYSFKMADTWLNLALSYRFLRNSFPYIDRKRIAMWGWSYGGYATLRTLILDTDKSPVFCCGVAVAPVTDWRWYHAGYVERLIGLPADNEENYNRSSVISHVSRLRDKKLLVVHGTSDDNVHFQHTAQLIKAMAANDIDFQSQIYPDEDHHMGGKSFNGTWISGHEILYVDINGHFKIYDVETLNRTMLIHAFELKHFYHNAKLAPGIEHRKGKMVLGDDEVNTEMHQLSPDRKFLMFGEFTVRKGAVRQAYFLLYNIENRTVTYLKPPQEEVPIELQLADFGSTGSQVIFVTDSEIYYQPSGGAEPISIFKSPVGHLFYRTVPADWATDDDTESPTYNFSEDGRWLAVVSYESSNLKDAEYGYYGDYDDTLNQYEEIVTCKFPKPGTPIPKTTVAIIDLSSKNATVAHLPPPKRFKHVDRYLSVIHWMTNDTLLVGWWNRPVNETNVEICARDGDGAWKCREIFDYQTNGFGYTYMMPEIVYTTGFITRYPVLGPSGHMFEHVVRVSDKGALDVLSSGDYQVTSLADYDEDNQIVYFIGTEPGKQRHRQLYKVLAGKAVPEVVCITCGSECSNNEVEFSGDMEYYALTCNGPSLPTVVIKRTANHSEVVTLEDNQELNSSLSTMQLPKTKVLRVHLSGPYYADVRLYIPADLPLNGSKKAPLVVYVYGGPEEQYVTDDHEVDFGSYLSASRGYIYAKMDVRGGGFEGLNKTFQMHNQLGTVEIQDFIKVTKFLRDSLPYIDRKKIGIWGWSYGGYATLRALILDTDEEAVFRCGVAVSPITDWLWYRAGYVERFLGLPVDNFDKYNQSSVISHVSALRDRKVLVIHGTNDGGYFYR